MPSQVWDDNSVPQCVFGIKNISTLDGSRSVRRGNTAMGCYIGNECTPRLGTTESWSIPYTSSATSCDHTASGDAAIDRRVVSLTMRRAGMFRCRHHVQIKQLAGMLRHVARKYTSYKATYTAHRVCFAPWKVYCDTGECCHKTLPPTTPAQQLLGRARSQSHLLLLPPPPHFAGCVCYSLAFYVILLTVDATRDIEAMMIANILHDAPYHFPFPRVFRAFLLVFTAGCYYFTYSSTTE